MIWGYHYFWKHPYKGRNKKLYIYIYLEICRREADRMSWKEGEMKKGPGPCRFLRRATLSQWSGVGTRSSTRGSGEISGWDGNINLLNGSCCFSNLYIRSYFQSNSYVYPKNVECDSMLTFVFCMGRNAWPHFRFHTLSKSIMMMKIERNNNQPSTMCWELTFIFSSISKTLVYIFVGCWFWTAKYGVICCSVRHKLYSFCFGACIMIRGQMGCDWNMNIIQSQWL